MRRTREQSEIASKLKDLQQEHSILKERSTHLSSLLHQQWDNYRRTRYREDLMLLITILHEANLVKERITRLSSNQADYEGQLKQKQVKPSSKTSAERLKAVTLELRELNKKRKGLEKDESDAIERCVSVIEFMDLEDMYQMTQSKTEVLTTEKKMLQKMLKK
jgi:hypothetical protein